MFLEMSQPSHKKEVQLLQDLIAMHGDSDTGYTRISQIYPWLYLGGVDLSEEFPRNTFYNYTEENPDVIISILSASDFAHPNVQEYDDMQSWISTRTPEWIRYTARDVPETPMKAIWREAAKKMHHAKQNGKTVFVHCFAGMSRSASTVLYYLWKYEKMPLPEALRFLLSRRPEVQPNEGFLKQLVRLTNQESES